MGKDELYNIKDVLDYQIFQIMKSKPPYSYAELYQIAYEGYLKAQKNFDPEYGQISLKYAGMYIRQALTSAIKKERDYSYRSTDMINSDYEDDSVEDPHRHWIENQPAEEPVREALDNRVIKISELLPLIPKKEADIIRAYYLEDKPKRLVDIAREQKVSKQRIHQLKDRGLEAISKLLEELDNE